MIYYKGLTAWGGQIAAHGPKPTLQQKYLVIVFPFIVCIKLSTVDNNINDHVNPNKYNLLLSTNNQSYVLNTNRWESNRNGVLITENFKKNFLKGNSNTAFMSITSTILTENTFLYIIHC